MVALPVYVFAETGSGTTTALLFLCQLVVAAVLGPIGGSLVDRLDLRRCLIGTNLAQAVTLAPLLAVTPSRTWPAYVVTVVQAALSQLNNPANVALLPRLVADDQLTSANAALSASRSMARLIGSPLGGLVVAAGGLAPVVLVDAVSFLAAAAAVAWITADTRPVGAHADAVPTGVRAGLRAVAANPPLTSVLTIHGIAQIAQGGFVVLFVVYVIEAVGGDGGAVGIIRGTMARRRGRRGGDHRPPRSSRRTTAALGRRVPRHGRGVTRVLERGRVDLSDRCVRDPLRAVGSARCGAAGRPVHRRPDHQPTGHARPRRRRPHGERGDRQRRSARSWPACWSITSRSSPCSTRRPASTSSAECSSCSSWDTHGPVRRRTPPDPRGSCRGRRRSRGWASGMAAC